MTDRTTKLLLWAIAIGIWANVLFRPAPVVERFDDQYVLGDLKNLSAFVEESMDTLNKIADGRCSNDKLC
jgi:hypothetical protein